jgi:hypothetical protein
MVCKIFSNILEGTATSIFKVGDGCGMFFRKSSQYLPDYTMSVLLFAGVGTSFFYYCFMQAPGRKMSKITIDRKAGTPFPPAPETRDASNLAPLPLQRLAMFCYENRLAKLELIHCNTRWHSYTTQRSATGSHPSTA